MPMSILPEAQYRRLHLALSMNSSFEVKLVVVVVGVLPMRIRQCRDDDK